jgi:hypothetical protein
LTLLRSPKKYRHEEYAEVLDPLPEPPAETIPVPPSARRVAGLLACLAALVATWGVPVGRLFAAPTWDGQAGTRVEYARLLSAHEHFESWLLVGYGVNLADAKALALGIWFTLATGICLCACSKLHHMGLMGQAITLAAVGSLLPSLVLALA